MLWEYLTTRVKSPAILHENAAINTRNGPIALRINPHVTLIPKYHI